MSLTSYRAAPPRVKRGVGEEESSVLCRPGGDLLSRVLRQSTIGAEAFDGRVRDGIGSDRLAKATRPAKDGAKQMVVYVVVFVIALPPKAASATRARP